MTVKELKEFLKDKDNRAIVYFMPGMIEIDYTNIGLSVPENNDIFEQNNLGGLNET